MKQLKDQDTGPILEEAGARECPNWKDNIDCSPMYKSHWVQWKSLTLSNVILKHYLESDGQPKLAQTLLSQSRMNDVLTKLHGGLSGGHFGINKTLHNVEQRYYWFQERNDVDKWCHQCDTYAVQSQPPNQELGPNASVQYHGLV
jgi:hypothetical protein